MQPKVWYRVAEVARLLGVNKGTLYKDIDDGKLVAHRFRNAIRVGAADLDAYIAASKIETKRSA